MSKKEKLKKKYFLNPESLSFGEIQTVLEYLGFEKIQAKGSHIKFKHPRLPMDIVFPVHGEECKDFYKKQSLKIIKRIWKIKK